MLLTRCGNWLAKFLTNVPRASDASEDPCELAGHEVVARMLYSQNHFSGSKQRPRPAAFIPPASGELSTIHITGLADIAIWEIGLNTLGDQRGRDKIYARADIPVKQLREHKLRAVLDNKPFKRHASVLGWPEEADPDQRKERWKEICVTLSASPEVLLVIPPEPIVREGFRP
jgi:hypothetical protein